MNKVFGFLFLVLSVSLSGCSPMSGGDSNKIKIGCAAPLTGDQATIGIDMCNGVELAIAQANDLEQQMNPDQPAFEFVIARQDDQHNPAQAVNVAKKFLSDPSILAVVGHFNSSCTKPTSAIYNSGGLVQITPASTNPEISKQGFKTFFRTAATDDVQGPKGAFFAVKKMGIKKIFIIDDKTTYGKGLADEFEKKAIELGADILGHEGITQGDKDFTPLLTKIKPLEPEMIYFGGIYPEGALLLRQARSLDISSVLMGGDGIATPIFLDLASSDIAEGTYATMVGGDIHQVPAAAPFIRDYEAKYGPVGQWSAYGYDSANVVIEAIRKAQSRDRASVLAAMRAVPKFPGITGEIVFDEKGDNQNQIIGIFQVKGGKLVYVGPAE